MMELCIEVKSGSMAEQPVDLLVNSSNTYLIMGSGTAQQLRDAGGVLPGNDKEYRSLVRQAKRENPILGKVLKYVHDQRPTLYKLQKERLKHIVNNGSKELEIGDVVLTSSGDFAKIKGKAKYIVDAIGMTYDWKVQPKPPIIPATLESVRESLEKSFDIATKLDCESLAVPVMCTRKGGLTKEESSEATLAALERLRGTKVREVAIVLYSDELEKEKDWFKGFYERSFYSPRIL